MTDPVGIYTQRYDSFLQTIASNLANLLIDHLAEVERIDQTTARAKTPKSFAGKAAKLTNDGALKYENPLTEIQDQLGARVVVFFESDVDLVETVIERYFQAIEEKELVPDSFWEFGYFGKHLMLALPHDVVPAEVELDKAPRFFELQIKTLFQHAWSQANHDLGYKTTKSLSGEQTRRLAFTAAQAWGADRIFQELHVELR
jgi:ppGpp synthetase/RelA/SpoT-type nucleotidyltranferase